MIGDTVVMAWTVWSGQAQEMFGTDRKKGNWTV